MNHRESELLFGLTAVHLGFAPREKLLEAAFAWADEPEPGLDDLLAGAMTPAQRAATAAVVAACVAKAGGDAAKALREAPVEASAQRALLGLRLPASLLDALIQMKPGARGADDRYRLGAEIGRGGLGRVVEAHDATLGRDVAVKLVLPDMPPALQERFAREARLTARLDHPHIVPVHDFGEVAGARGRQLFLCMKRVRGRSLSEVVRQLEAGDAAAAKSWTRARLLGVLQDICLGAAYAHSKGVIHRDLKPSNVMLGDFGETLVLDWGLARETGDPPEPEPGQRTRLRAPKVGSSTLTMEGDVLGTPAYMPPEQAEGRLADMDARSDVFSLGAILFELLTFRPPYRAATPDEVLELARAGQVAPPSTIARDVPPELDAIVARACAGNREDRYPTALALHHDLQLFLEGVAARERRRAEALATAEAGKRELDAFRALEGEIDRQRARVAELTKTIERWRTVDERRPLWAAEDSLRALEDRRALAWAEASARFARALELDADCAAARDGACELALDRYLQAEENKDRFQMQTHRRALEAHDRTGAFAARLEAPGRLTIRVFRYRCRCAGPAKGLAVEFGEEPVVPWRAGGYAPAEPLADWDLPVPRVRVRPAPPGHGPECGREELSDVEITASPYVLLDRRRVPGPSRALGRAPLRDVPLPRGGWRLVLTPPPSSGLRAAVVPVLVERGRGWEQDVTLYPDSEIPEDMLQVAAGPFTFQLGHPASRPFDFVRDVFLSRFPVTCAQYLDYLNDLLAAGQGGEARARAPRDAKAPFWTISGRGKRARFELPPPGRRFAWQPSWPVLAITWHDAMAYAAWLSARTGRLLAPPHEAEWEKAARGPDRRDFPWGEEFDYAFSHTYDSVKGNTTPLPVGSFAADESPYGIRDLSGGVITWCLNAPAAPGRSNMMTRGGSWSTGWHEAWARGGGPPHILRENYGIRLAWRPWAMGEE